MWFLYSFKNVCTKLDGNAVLTYISENVEYISIKNIRRHVHIFLAIGKMNILDY